LLLILQKNNIISKANNYVVAENLGVSNEKRCKIPVSAVNVMGFAKESAAIVANVVITPTTADVLRTLDTVVVVVGWVLGLIGPATGAVFLNKVNPPFILRVFFAS
jgi:hypothetical protein